MRDLRGRHVHDNRRFVVYGKIDARITVLVLL
jgi:hypothetical protein